VLGEITYLYLVDLIILSGAQTTFVLSSGRPINKEAVAYFKELHRKLRGWAKGNHENLIAEALTCGISYTIRFMKFRRQRPQL
jgi:hypothetical protein